MFLQGSSVLRLAVKAIFYEERAKQGRGSFFYPLSLPFFRPYPFWCSPASPSLSFSSRPLFPTPPSPSGKDRQIQLGGMEIIWWLPGGRWRSGHQCSTTVSRTANRRTSSAIVTDSRRLSRRRRRSSTIGNSAERRPIHVRAAGPVLGRRPPLHSGRPCRRRTVNVTAVGAVWSLGDEAVRVNAAGYYTHKNLPDNVWQRQYTIHTCYCLHVRLCAHITEAD